MHDGRTDTVLTAAFPAGRREAAAIAQVSLLGRAQESVTEGDAPAFSEAPWAFWASRWLYRSVWPGSAATIPPFWYANPSITSSPARLATVIVAGPAFLPLDVTTLENGRYGLTPV